MGAMLDLDISLSSRDVVTCNIANEMTKKDKPSPGVSCCVHHGAILIQLKATLCVFPPAPTTSTHPIPPHPLRKRSCQAQAQNNKAESRGGAWGDHCEFACSCLPFPRPQRPIKGPLMEYDKLYPTPLYSTAATVASLPSGSSLATPVWPLKETEVCPSHRPKILVRTGTPTAGAEVFLWGMFVEVMGHWG